MKTIKEYREFNVYKYEELTEDAKEVVNNWYLNDDIRNDIFYEEITEDLKYLFPYSKLDVQYSLASCQGDGLNVYGKLELSDFMEIDEKTGYKVFADYTGKEIKRIKFYLNYFTTIEFSQNNRYCYSCKFLDKQEIEYYIIDEWIDNLEYDGIRDIDKKLIDRFLHTVIDWFEKYDGENKESGYTYFYEVDESEVKDFCSINNYYFTEDGELYGYIPEDQKTA